MAPALKSHFRLAQLAIPVDLDVADQAERSEGATGSALALLCDLCAVFRKSEYLAGWGRCRSFCDPKKFNLIPIQLAGVRGQNFVRQ